MIHMAKTTEEEMTQKPSFGEIIEEDKGKKKKLKKKENIREKDINEHQSTRLYIKMLVDSSYKTNIFCTKYS